MAEETEGQDRDVVLAPKNPDNGIMGSVGTGSVSRRGLLGVVPGFAAGGLVLTRAPALVTSQPFAW